MRANRPGPNRFTLADEALSLLLLLLALAWAASGQNSAVVFQNAYLRPFLVTNCSNTNPIVVTIAAPAATDALTYVPLDAGSLVTINAVSGNTACNVSNQAINVLTPTTFELTGVAGNGAYQTGGNGYADTISDATTPSVVLNNQGQTGHMLSIEFPTAMATVTPIQVRLEVADTCPDPPFCAGGDWRPIQPDTTEVDLVGTAYYQLSVANGTWRAIRVNSVAATPASLPMRVDYTGMPFPIGRVVRIGNRFEITNIFNIGDGSYEFVAGACQAGVAGLAFNGPAPLPEAQCITGAGETLAVAAFDTTTTECVEDSLFLPPSGTPTSTALNVLWQASNTGTLQWSLQTACVGPGDQLGAVGYGAATNLTATSAVANELINSEFPIVTTGCLAGELMFFRFCRTGATGTLAVDALMKSLEFAPAQ